MSNEFIIKALKFNQDDYLNFLMQKVRDLRSGEIDYGEVEQEIRKDLGRANVTSLLLKVQKLLVSYPESEREKTRAELLDSIYIDRCKYLAGRD